jgi:hypothetical protein
LSLKDTPFYKLVPKDLTKNLEWRVRWRKAAIRDKGLQHDFRQMAMDDILFFFAAFGWAFEPRAAIKILPFVPWKHQEQVMVDMDKAVDDAEDLYESTQTCLDVVLDKSRGQGATWMYLMICLRRWLRDEMFSAGLVTRTESLVDSDRDPDTLMWKVIWAIKMLPAWMMPEGFQWKKHRNVTEHSLLNPENGASIVGYAATGDVARGGRKTLFCIDEIGGKEFITGGKDHQVMNSTQHVANCRFLVSTFGGDSGAFYDAAEDAKAGNSESVYLVLDWKDNPMQNHKLYELKHGTIRDVDPDKHGGKLNVHEIKMLRAQHNKLARRGYKVRDKIRNSWYNHQCLRPGATPRGIAQELDRDPKGSVSKVISATIIQKARADCARPPDFRGRMLVDMETGTAIEPYIVPDEMGELSLWFKPGLDGLPPFGIHSVGIDIGGGTGGSFTANSVASVLNKMTGEQVAEWSSNLHEPRRFGIICVAICRYFNDAVMIPEANFGAGFMKVVEDELCYPKLWQRETQISGLKTLTKKNGFWMANDDTKMALFEGMVAAIGSGTYIPRSIEMLEECGQYEWKNGKIVHVGSTKSEDEGAKGKSHSDRVIAAALSVYEMGESVIDDGTGDDDETIEVPEGSMASRLRESDARANLSGDPWIDANLDIFGTTTIGHVDTWR